MADTDHVESRPCRDGGVTPLNIFHANPGERDGDHSPESQYLFHEGSDVRDLFFYKALLPGIAIGVDFHDLGVGALLDFLAVW